MFCTGLHHNEMSFALVFRLPFLSWRSSKEGEEEEVEEEEEEEGKRGIGAGRSGARGTG